MLLGTSHSELGSFELGTDDLDLLEEDHAFTPSLQPKVAATAKRVLEDSVPGTLDPNIEELFREKPARPLVVRGEVVAPHDEPPVVVLKGTPIGPTINIGTFVNVEKVVMAPRGLPARRKRRKQRSRFRSALAARPQTKLAAPPTTATAPEPIIIHSGGLSTQAVLLIGIAILGAILIGIAIANRPKPRKVSHARAIRQ